MSSQSMPSRPATTRRMEEGPDDVAVQRGASLVSASKDDCDTRSGGDPSCFQLVCIRRCDTGGGGFADHDLLQSSSVRTSGSAVPRAARRTVMPVDVGEQHQRSAWTRCATKAADRSLSPIGLRRRDGVVLVDDRHHAHLQQRHEGGVERCGSDHAGDIVQGQEDLTGDLIVARELVGVAMNEASLPYRGELLLPGQVARTPRERQRGQASSNSSEETDDDLHAARVRCCQGVDESPDPVRIDPAGRRSSRTTNRP